MALTADPIITAAKGQQIFDVNDEDELIRLLNSLSAKARAYLNRVQLNQNLSTAITERLRGPVSPMLFLHAPVYISDLTTYPLTVKTYSGGTLGNTYNASDDDVIVTTNDFSARVDLASGFFPETEGGSYIEIEYFGGWATIPGDVYAGAIMQGRIELKRMHGEIGMQNHSVRGGSVSMTQHGLAQEVAEMWRLYRILI